MKGSEEENHESKNKNLSEDKENVLNSKSTIPMAIKKNLKNELKL